jgi:hypothetical protein
LNKSYLQDFLSDLFETLPEHLSLNLRSTFPGASNCYSLKRCLHGIQVDSGDSIVIEPGGHYSIVCFGVFEGTIDVSLCVLENAQHQAGHLITGVELTALTVCQCTRIDDNYLHLFCNPYELKYPLIDFPDIPSIN